MTTIQEKKEISFPRESFSPFFGCISHHVNQNKIENILLNNKKMDNFIKPFGKNDYLEKVRCKRKKFVHKHFEKELKEIFEQLEHEASKMRNCHLEIKFDCPDHFDVGKIESLLRDYFGDIGFETIAEPRKGENNTIVLTLT